MKRIVLVCAAWVGVAAAVLPAASGCVDCNMDGFPESLLFCRNGTAMLTEVSKPVEPADFSADGEPEFAGAME